MKFKDKYNISEEFEELFAFDTEEEELAHDAQMLTFKFLEALEKSQTYGAKLKKKDIAKAIGKSPSFISQLYSGDKLISMALLAKIQKVFDIHFEINAKRRTAYYDGFPTFNGLKLSNEPVKFERWMKNNPDYSQTLGHDMALLTTKNDMTAA